jgi:phospholipid-binding lipoprotein MlaA
VALLLAATARAGDVAAAAGDPLFGETEDLPGYPDPCETTNRAVFAANRQIDYWVIEPVVRGYTRVVPGLVRRSVRRFFLNLNSPSVLVNDLLQREWRDAGVVTARLVVNTTAGLAGFADPAGRLGLAPHHSDFGQTLALAGVGSGPYFIMPLLGPTTARDGFGVIVDLAFRPTTYLFGSVVFAELIPIFPGAPGLQDQFLYQTIQGGGTGFVVREESAAQIDALRSSSIDFYATLRSAYTQSREASSDPARAPPGSGDQARRARLTARGPRFSPQVGGERLNPSRAITAV